MTAVTEQIHFRNCNLCDAMCGLEIKVRGDQVLSIRGDDKDLYSRGHICPKGVALQDVYNDPDRLTHPLRRTQDGWEKISWDDALDEVADQMIRVQKKYGKDALGVYVGNPVGHNYSPILFLAPLLKTLNTKNRFSAASTDSLPIQLVAYLMFGHQVMLPVPDMERTDFFLIFGANPAVSNGSIMGLPDALNRLKAIEQRGGKMVVVDPRFSETSALASQHIFIRPGTDVLLLLAMFHTLFEERLISPGRLHAISDGIETLKQVTKDFSPEAVSDLTGIEAKTIRQLVRDFAHARSAVCYGRLGTCIQEFGSVTSWLILAFNIVTEKMDRPGGFMFNRPAVDLVAIASLLGEQGHFDRWRSRVRKLPEYSGEFPVVTLAEEIMTPGKGQIKALMTVAGNPVLSTPNGQLMEEGLKQLDFMVAVDFYINETTQYAHLILPPTTSLEYSHYGLLFHALSVRNTAKFGEPIFKPKGDVKHEWEIFMELQIRLLMRPLRGKAIHPLIQWTLQKIKPETLLDLAIRLGPHGIRSNPVKGGLTLKKLKASVHGLDLGPMEPCLPQRLPGKHKRIQLAPTLLVEDIQRVRQKFFDTSSSDRHAGKMLLIGRRHLRSNNSWMHNSMRLVKGKNRCTAILHPVDGVKYKIESGDQIRVSSRAGSIQIEAKLSEEIMPGVISIPHGWGHHGKGLQIETAQNYAGVSVNDITDHTFIDVLSGTAAMNGVPVTIQKM